MAHDDNKTPGVLPDVVVTSGFVLRDARGMTKRERLLALGFLMDALRYLPIDVTCNVPSPTIDQVAAETGQSARLEAIRALRVSEAEREADSHPKLLAVVRAATGQVVGALELSSIQVVRETPSEVGYRARSFPAFQWLVVGNPNLQASYVPWVRAHTMAVRELMQAQFPAPGGKVGRLDSIVVITSSATPSPLVAAFEAEVAALVVAGTIVVEARAHPRIPEVTIRVISRP